MYLFFDVETDGLPKSRNGAIDDVDNWPNIVQLAWALYDKNQYCVASRNEIRFGIPITQKLTNIHGIDPHMISTFGRGISEMLKGFSIAANKAAYFIAHNSAFDVPIINCEFLRYKDIPTPFTKDSRIICTMKATTKYCRLKNKNGAPKWPKLRELHKHLFGTHFASAHNAMFDVFATARCFFELQKRGVITYQLIK